jgi:hypothetical protein
VRKREEAVDRDAILTGMWTAQDDLVEAANANLGPMAAQIVEMLD